MGTMQDTAIAIGVESTYGTAVTPGTFVEFLSETLDWKKNVKQSPSLRVGRRLNLARGRVIPTAEGSGQLNFEAMSKGQGLLWQLLMGAGTSTLVSGTTYQQVFTFADVMPSVTLQKQMIDAGATVRPQTYSGVMCEGFDVEFADDTLKVAAALNAHDMTTATAAAEVVMPSSAMSLYSFVGASLYTGTLAEPAATTLGSAATSLANIRSGKISVKHNLNVGRYNYGGSGRKAKPLVRTRDLSVSLVAEFDSATMTDAILNETPMTFVATFTGAALSAGVETLQFVIPCMYAEGELPKSNGDDLILQNMTFTALSNLSSTQPMWVVARTSDTAI